MGLGALGAGDAVQAPLDHGNAHPALLAVVHSVVCEIEAIVIAEGPCGKLKGHAVLPVIFFRLGFVPFEGLPRFHNHNNTAMPYISRGGTSPIRDAAFG